MGKSSLERDFIMYANMAGISQGTRSNQFVFGGRTYRVNVLTTPQIDAGFGSKVRANRLLRFAAFTQLICNDPAGSNVFGVVGPSFDALSQTEPLLRTYYEGAALSGQHCVWIRW